MTWYEILTIILGVILIFGCMIIFRKIIGDVGGLFAGFFIGIVICSFLFMISPSSLRAMDTETNRSVALNSAIETTQIVTINKKYMDNSGLTERYYIYYNIGYTYIDAKGNERSGSESQRTAISKEEFDKVSIGDKYDRFNYRFVNE